MNAARCKKCGAFTSKDKVKHLKTISLVDAVTVTVNRMLCPKCFKAHVNDILEKQKAMRKGFTINRAKIPK